MKITANDGTQVTLGEAVQMWEAGEFSDWVEAHGGFPLEIDGVPYAAWKGVEDALSDGEDASIPCRSTFYY